MAETVINMDAIQASERPPLSTGFREKLKVLLIFIVCFLKSPLHNIPRVPDTLSFVLPPSIFPLLSFFFAYSLD